jgi:hypothetical protein
MSDPTIEKYKSALTNLGVAVKSAHKTKEGKQLSSDYWVDVIKMLKKAKLGISMVELGIDDESEISTTHDTSPDSKSNSDDPNTPQESPPDVTDTPDGSTDSKLASLGLKNESYQSKQFHDIMNHLGILLSEQFGEIKKDGVECSVDIDSRKFTIKFDEKFFMVTEDYNFELGGVEDIQKVVDAFTKLSLVSHEELVSEYNKDLV